jgi:RNA polymerase sigma-70 factor, ECF subfamily
MQLNETSDAELIALYLRGDAQAFNVLELRYRRHLFAWLVSALSNRADAEDIYQDVWFKVVSKAELFRDVSFKAWLWTIARNRVIDFRRKHRPDLTLDQPSGSADKAPLVDRLSAQGSDPAGQLETRDLTVRVMQFADKLPSGQRDVFLMRVEGHLAFKEIADVLGISINTALGRMRDAMTKIRSHLTEVTQ